MTADDPAHGRIVPEAVGVVHVLIASKSSKRRLTEQPRHPVLAVLPGSRVKEAFFRELGQSENLVEFPEGKETRVGRDL